MTEQAAFLAQAASDYRVFQILLNLDRARVPACHPLHYLQMATEKLAKAVMIALGQRNEDLTHVAFSQVPYLLSRRSVAPKLGRQNAKAFRQFLKSCAPLFREIDELNPSIGPQNSNAARHEQANVEYPWLTRDAGGVSMWQAPAMRDWPLLEKLRSGMGAQVLQLVELLIERFEAVFR